MISFRSPAAATRQSRAMQATYVRGQAKPKGLMARIVRTGRTLRSAVRNAGVEWFVERFVERTAADQGGLESLESSLARLQDAHRCR